jgi:hypothetical protein
LTWEEFKLILSGCQLAIREISAKEPNPSSGQIFAPLAAKQQFV